MMSQEKKALIRRIFNEILNKGNLAVADELYTINYIYHGPGGQGKRES